MPGLAPARNVAVAVYRTAQDIPANVREILAGDQRAGNIILPRIQKALHDEATGVLPGSNAWFVVSSAANSFARSEVVLIAALTEGPLGTYPLFILHTQPLIEFTDHRLAALVHALAETIYSHVDIERVFSVFAAESITRAFAHAWTAMTGVQVARGEGKAPEEYYAALLTYCDRRTFRPRATTLHPTLTFDIRPARLEDVPAVAQLCYGFAEASAPFTLTMDQATAEAEMLVKYNMVWVHAVVDEKKGKQGIASICATTRVSEAVAGITKVYTNPDYRRMGCAERLVRRVCHHMLRSESKQSVVLFVAHDNPAARNVYRRVGFVGLENEVVPGVERWLEIGFDRTVVDLGHW
jgi:ribosomal protein S18 acetylase RimI-like enzyme